jgi:hypothetical protein
MEMNVTYSHYLSPFAEALADVVQAMVFLCVPLGLVGQVLDLRRGRQFQPGFAVWQRIAFVVQFAGTCCAVFVLVVGLESGRRWRLTSSEIAILVVVAVCALFGIVGTLAWSRLRARIAPEPQAHVVPVEAPPASS